MSSSSQCGELVWLFNFWEDGGQTWVEVAAVVLRNHQEKSRLCVWQAACSEQTWVITLCCPGSLQSTRQSRRP